MVYVYLLKNVIFFTSSVFCVLLFIFFNKYKCKEITISELIVRQVQGCDHTLQCSIFNIKRLTNLRSLHSIFANIVLLYIDYRTSTFFSTHMERQFQWLFCLSLENTPVTTARFFQQVWKFLINFSPYKES